VAPQRLEYIGDLVEPLSQIMWEYLHDRYTREGAQFNIEQAETPGSTSPYILAWLFEKKDSSAKDCQS